MEYFRFGDNYVVVYDEDTVGTYEDEVEQILEQVKGEWYEETQA